MKIFCFIFSIYLLLLSVQPCQGIAAVGFSQPKTENEQSNLQNHEETEDCETHECSPFCICSCRQISVPFNFSAVAINQETAAFTKEFPKVFSQDNYHLQYFDSIWQPPKFNFIA
jgi:hypothetical protein